jgi:hypothetical protein
MPQLIDKPTRIESAGNKPKVIEEIIGRVNSGHADVSVALMRSPAGWAGPAARLCRDHRRAQRLLES